MLVNIACNRRRNQLQEVLALRGRIILVAPSAAVAIRFESVAAWNHAKIVQTRGIEDSFTPLSEWRRIWNIGEYAVLSCDQYRYVDGPQIPATDIVWIGETGHPYNTPHIWLRFCQAMSRADRIEEGARPVRPWLIDEGAL